MNIYPAQLQLNTPEIVKFLQEMTSDYSLILWIVSCLLFIIFGLDPINYESSVSIT